MEKQSKKKRHSYTRKFKLKVSDWYINNGKKIARTAQMFGVDRKQVRTWSKNIVVKPLGEVAPQHRV